MPSETVQFLRRFAPVIASATVICTLIICVIISKVNHRYVGGLKWPYFSDMGRDAPGYYVFCVGLSIVATALGLTWYFNYIFQKALLRRPIEMGYVSKFTLWWARLCVILGISSIIGLPILAFFSTTSYPSTHNYAADWFFFLETIAIFANTLVSYKIYRSVQQDHTQEKLVKTIRRTFLIQRVAFISFFIAFLIYLPIGLSVIKDFIHLPISECLEKNLGVDYCTIEMRLNDVDTKLWDYEHDFAMSQMRAAGQLVCIITLVGYSISFMTHDYVNVVDHAVETYGDAYEDLPHDNLPFIVL